MQTFHTQIGFARFCFARSSETGAGVLYTPLRNAKRVPTADSALVRESVAKVALAPFATAHSASQAQNVLLSRASPPESPHHHHGPDEKGPHHHEIDGGDEDEAATCEVRRETRQDRGDGKEQERLAFAQANDDPPPRA